MRTALILLFFLTPSLTRAQDPWAVASSISLLADWSQSVDAYRHPYPTNTSSWDEANVILGHHPQLYKINLYNGACLILNATIPQLFPKKTRDLWWALLTGFEGAIVIHQARIGLHFNTHF